ncbi:GreA/GreB family elongation factor [Sphingomonas solaris]|uniref:Nucleoside-diphosphate kinase n=1 Tax=Alterirhizorhabdus solaris TaxID=2529389 RepID=A0A558QX38_9SPHN|nr:GreA/GreB family elongation factor [Sphingomonas solaris]TVV71668.1 nucleoside-diphosphate kinase [Sphingomonas solaris]
MSVAFRRESDEEHLEPRFELPIPPGPNLVTPRGLALIVARVAALDAALAVESDEARLTELRRDLRYWRARQASARPTPPAEGEEAGFASRIVYRRGGIEATVDIVGHDEADPAHGRLAFTAPLARVLIGAGAGDRVDFAGQADAIEILSVGPIPD